MAGKNNAPNPKRVTMCIEKYIEDIRNLVGEKKKGYELYYRGENAQYETSLCPSLFRKEYETEGQMLLDLISYKPEDFPRYEPTISHWCLAQHHGLPTRLLDITKNPHIALYFSCVSNYDKSLENSDGSVCSFQVKRETVKSFNSNSACIISNFARLDKNEQSNLIESVKCRKPDDIIKMKYNREAKLLYRLIREEKPSFDEHIHVRDLFRIFVIHPLMLFDRIRAQEGAFFISAFPYDYRKIQLGSSSVTRFLKGRKVCDEICSAIGKEIYVYSATKVDSGNKFTLREELSRMGITDEFLFPEIDRFAKAIAQKYRMGTENNNHET